MVHKILSILLSASLSLGLGLPAQAAGFSDWAAIVVAGDHRTESGNPTEVFDNARRDVSQSLLRMGFKPDHIAQFSTHPEHYNQPGLQESTSLTIGNTLWDLSSRAKTGCLAYLVSHGSEDGMVLGTRLLSPDRLATLINTACGDRPSVIVISACYSGIFVSDLYGPNRLILTAAAPDRSSFGCGSADTYPYFDTCFLQNLPSTHDFTTLATKTRACIRDKEIETGMEPPSEPQLAIGADITANLPGW